MPLPSAIMACHHRPLPSQHTIIVFLSCTLPPAAVHHPYKPLSSTSLPQAPPDDHYTLASACQCISAPHFIYIYIILKCLSQIYHRILVTNIDHCCPPQICGDYPLPFFNQNISVTNCYYFTIKFN